MKNPLVIKVNKQNYLYSFKKKQLLLITKELSAIIKLYLEKYTIIKMLNMTDTYNYLSLSISKSDFELQYNKFLFFKDHGFLDIIDKEIAQITSSKIEKTIKSVKNIAFDVTDDCNLSCSYCIYGELYTRADNTRKKGRFSVKAAKEIIDSNFKNIKNPKRIDNCGISFYGGEPLINFNFITEIVNYVKNKWSEVPVRFAMTTNGLLLNKYMKFIAENGFLLLISLDGNEEHNKLRLLKNGGSSFNIVHNNILKLKNTYPEYFNTHVNLNTVLHDHNINEIAELDDFFMKNYNKRSMKGEVHDLEIKEENNDAFQKIIGQKNTRNSKESILEKYCTKDLDHNLELVKNNISENIVKPFFLNSTCLPCQVKMFITNNGSIFPCEKVGEELILGNYFEDKMNFDFERITKRYNEYRNLSMKKCKTCYKLNCVECIYRIDFNDENCCKSYVSEKDFTKELINLLETSSKNN